MYKKFMVFCVFLWINIARGTTDPEIDSVTWIKFSNNMDTVVLNGGSGGGYPKSGPKLSFNGSGAS